MTDAGYIRTLDVVASCGRLFLELDGDLDTCRRTVEAAHALGPILDPSGYNTPREGRAAPRPAAAARHGDRLS